jgi:hypothetical protein
MTGRQTDASRLSAALCQLSPSVKSSSDRAWSRQPALRVIDCVLSLNRSYDLFVVPRLDAFEQEHSAVRSVIDLKEEIAKYLTPHQFMVETLNYRHEARAIILSSVVDWLAKVAADDRDSTAQLEIWAKTADPRTAKSLGIRGFGLAGFQYLRMLFGANTVKPDLHICRYVSSCVGHPVSPIEALQLLETAALEANVALRDVDTTIWELSARTDRRSVPRGSKNCLEPGGS